jgi:indolepyruvate ferredoxin oxidoreductase, alpha subunit
MSGDKALARGAEEAGVSIISSYPGEPVSIPVEVLIRKSKLYGTHAEWSVNEKVAFEVALGASYAGLRAIVLVKHVGFNWILDPLAGSSYTGVGGGLVVVVGDDPDASGSTSEEDTRLLTELIELPLFEPSTPDEARLMVRCIRALRTDLAPGRRPDGHQAL